MITRKDVSSDAAHPMMLVTLPPHLMAFFLILVSNTTRISKAIESLDKMLKGKESTKVGTASDALLEGYSGDGESSEESDVDTEF